MTRALSEAPLARWSLRRSRRELDVRSACRDTLRYPCLHFAFNPPHGANANLYSLWKSLFSFELVDHGASQTRYIANLREAKNLQRDCRWFSFGAHCRSSAAARDSGVSAARTCIETGAPVFGGHRRRRRRRIDGHHCVGPSGRRLWRAMTLAQIVLGGCVPGTSRFFCIHWDTSDLIQPAQRPRNRRFAGNLPINARPQKYHRGRRISLATS